jgi:hypothetical protein
MEPQDSPWVSQLLSLPLRNVCSVRKDEHKLIYCANNQCNWNENPCPGALSLSTQAPDLIQVLGRLLWGGEACVKPERWEERQAEIWARQGRSTRLGIWRSGETQDTGHQRSAVGRSGMPFGSVERTPDSLYKRHDANQSALGQGRHSLLAFWSHFVPYF